ncbi:C40 family peptidase [Alphaproteobacteria bacterium]|nr:C40 family peptidase [Alphaproteobacteria bacterium]
MNIIKSSTGMKSTPSENSSLETECLFGEAIEVLDQNLDWVYCRLITDNYYGWVKKSGIAKFRKATHRVLNVRTFIYKDADVKSDILLYLPMGANLVVKEINTNWAEIFFLINNMIKVGYVPLKHIVNFNHKVSDWVKVAQSLEGTPYKWGGRDTLGIDCSALLQLSYQTYGQVISRNTSDQVNLEKPNISEFNNLRRGCVIFWEGHVGIMVDKVNCIHANAYHMKTVTEPLIYIIDRMDKDHQILKMMDFNE